jgi:hypothetical protein
MFALGLLMGVPAAGRVLSSPLAPTISFFVAGFVLLAAGVALDFAGDNVYSHAFDTGQTYGIAKDVLMLLGGIAMLVGMVSLMQIEIKMREKEGRA